MRKSKTTTLRTLSRIALGSSCIAGIIIIFFIYRLSRDLPTLEQISSHSVSQTTKLYDRTGTILLYEIAGDRERTIVPSEKIPRCLKEATIVVEDEKFYEEPAFDWKAIIRAFLVNLRHGKVVQGGSTITQQLAKNAFLTPEQTIARKIKEIILATKIHTYYSKEQILNLYINEIPYGPTIYGAGTASESYFGKPLWELNLAQCTLLAAIPKAPSYYSPWGTHTEQLFGRHAFVLEKMRSFGKITQKEFKEALSFKFSFTAQRKGIKAPHFVMTVHEYLTQKYGENIVQKGGLRVLTTLDWDLQQLAEKAVAEGARRNSESYGGTNAALVAENPKTGEVLALVGSADYFDTDHEGNFNVATQGLRQPGSALKPFAYLTAFEKGYSPETVVFDVPTEFVSNNPSCPPIPNFSLETLNECFHPQNYDEQFRGPITLRQALSQSINIPAVKVLYLAGLRDVIQNTAGLGLSTLADHSRYGLALVLGGGEVRLIELLGAYATLATDGIRHAQSFILSVQDPKGQILESLSDAGARVVPAQPVRLINNILSDIDARRGLLQSSLRLTTFPGYDVALKTGTSNDYRDAWALGYSPALAVGVWAGNNDNSPMHRKGSSILAAIPIWNEFIKVAIKKFPADPFIKPEPVNPEKPILRGDYLSNKELHSILYYVDKNDPKGPPPTTPTDPQFANWETGVLAWGRNNLPNFFEYNTTNTPSSPLPVISIRAPLAGALATQNIFLEAGVEGLSLQKIRVLWNGALLEEIFFSQPTNKYTISKTYPLPSPAKPQNMLELQATASAGLSTASTVVVYQAGGN